MPAEGQIIPGEGGEAYRLAKELGRGAIATVWEATKADGSKVAVKIAHGTLHPDLRKQFDTEYETLGRILEKTEVWPAGPRIPPVPAFVQRAGSDTLVTELIKVPSLAAQVKDETDLARRQGRLVEPAYQYAWFLDFLHNRVAICQADRKAGDLYWDKARNRLVVLDWNVIEDGTGRAPEDVYKFGEMWYALILGVPPIFDGDWTAHPDWENLSAVWRNALSACLRTNRLVRPTAQELRAIMTGLRDAYRQPGRTLLDRGRETLEQFQSLQGAESVIGASRTETEPSRMRDAWPQLEEAWLQLDLAWRRGAAEAQDLAAKARGLLDMRGQAALEELKEDLKSGFYKDAEDPLEQAETELGSSLEGRLRVARWRCLYDAAQASRADELGGALRDQMPNLVPGVEQLDGGAWIKADGHLSDALGRFPTHSETRRVLGSLSAEVTLHMTLKEAKRLQSQEDFAAAAEQFKKAQALLQQVSYREALSATVVDLVDAQAECERLAETKGKLNGYLERLPKAVEDGDYGEARKLFDKALPLTGSDPQARQVLEDAVAPLFGLEKLQLTRQDPDTPKVEWVRKAQDLLRSFPNNLAVQNQAAEISVNLLSDLELHAKNVVVPKEVDRYLGLGRTLQQLIESVGPARSESGAFIRCQSAVKALEKKQNLQRQLRAAYEQDDEKIQSEAVRRAQAAGIELYDDQDRSVAKLDKFSRQEVENQRLERLLTKRSELESRMEQGQDELRQRTDEFETFFNEKQNDLQGKRETLAKALAGAQNILEKQASVLGRFESEQARWSNRQREAIQLTSDLSEAYRTLNTYVSQMDLAPARKTLEEAEGLLRDLEKINEQLECETTEYRKQRRALDDQAKRTRQQGTPSSSGTSSTAGEEQDKRRKGRSTFGGFSDPASLVAVVFIVLIIIAIICVSSILLIRW